MGCGASTEGLGREGAEACSEPGEPYPVPDAGARAADVKEEEASEAADLDRAYGAAPGGPASPFGPSSCGAGGAGTPTPASMQNELQRRKTYLTYLSALQRARNSRDHSYSTLSTKASDDTVALWKAGLRGRLGAAEGIIMTALTAYKATPSPAPSANASPRPNASMVGPPPRLAVGSALLPQLRQNHSERHQSSRGDRVSPVLPSKGTRSSISASRQSANASFAPPFPNTDAAGKGNLGGTSAANESSDEPKAEANRADLGLLLLSMQKQDSAVFSSREANAKPSSRGKPEHSGPHNSSFSGDSPQPTFEYTTEVVAFFPIVTIEESRLPSESIAATAPAPLYELGSCSPPSMSTCGIARDVTEASQRLAAQSGTSSVILGAARHGEAGGVRVVVAGSGSGPSTQLMQNTRLAETGVAGGNDKVAGHSSRENATPQKKWRLLTFYEACAIDKQCVYAVGVEEEGVLPVANISFTVSDLKPGEEASGCMPPSTRVLPKKHGNSITDANAYCALGGGAPGIRPTAVGAKGLPARSDHGAAFHYSQNVRCDLLWCGDRFADTLARRWIIAAAAAGAAESARQAEVVEGGREGPIINSRVLCTSGSLPPLGQSANGTSQQSPPAGDDAAHRSSNNKAARRQKSTSSALSTPAIVSRENSMRRASSTFRISRQPSERNYMDSDFRLPQLQPLLVAGGNGPANSGGGMNLSSLGVSALRAQSVVLGSEDANSVPPAFAPGAPSSERVDVLIVDSQIHFTDENEKSEEQGEAAPGWCSIVVAFVVPLSNLSDSFAVGILLSIRVRNVNSTRDYLSVTDALLSAQQSGSKLHTAVLVAAKALM